VSLGTLTTPEPIGRYLDAFPEGEDLALRPAVEIEPYAQAHISFKKDARRLKDLMEVIIGRSPFPDADTEGMCVDLANVRNIILHGGGWPDDATAGTIKRHRDIIQTEAIGNANFYELKISHDFMNAAFRAIGETVKTIDKALLNHPDYRQA